MPYEIMKLTDSVISITLTEGMTISFSVGSISDSPVKGLLAAFVAHRALSYVFNKYFHPRLVAKVCDVFHVDKDALFKGNSSTEDEFVDRPAFILKQIMWFPLFLTGYGETTPFIAGEQLGTIQHRLYTLVKFITPILATGALTKKTHLLDDLQLFTRLIKSSKSKADTSTRSLCKSQGTLLGLVLWAFWSEVQSDVPNSTVYNTVCQMIWGSIYMVISEGKKEGTTLYAAQLLTHKLLVPQNFVVPKNFSYAESNELLRGLCYLIGRLFFVQLTSDCLQSLCAKYAVKTGAEGAQKTDEDVFVDASDELSLDDAEDDDIFADALEEQTEAVERVGTPTETSEVPVVVTTGTTEKNEHASSKDNPSFRRKSVESIVTLLCDGKMILDSELENRLKEHPLHFNESEREFIIKKVIQKFGADALKGKPAPKEPVINDPVALHAAWIKSKGLRVSTPPDIAPPLPPDVLADLVNHIPDSTFRKDVVAHVLNQILKRKVYSMDETLDRLHRSRFCFRQRELEFFYKHWYNKFSEKKLTVAGDKDGDVWEDALDEVPEPAPVAVPRVYEHEELFMNGDAFRRDHALKVVDVICSGKHDVPRILSALRFAPFSFNQLEMRFIEESLHLSLSANLLSR